MKELYFKTKDAFTGEIEEINVPVYLSNFFFEHLINYTSEREGFLARVKERGDNVSLLENQVVNYHLVNVSVLENQVVNCHQVMDFLSDFTF